MLRVRFELPKVLALGDIRTRSDFLMALASVVGVIDRAIQRNFDEEGRPDPWKPLSPGYELRKFRKLLGTKILELEGNLRRSIRIRIDTANPSSVAIVASSSLPYAAIHNFGGFAGRRRKTYIPPRPYLVLTKDDEEELGRAIIRGLAEER